MTVRIPSPLFTYTAGRNRVEARGETIRELLDDLDRRYPGIRFRMVDEQDRVRPHMRIFVNGTAVGDLGREIGSDDDIQIIQALSGG